MVGRFCCRWQSRSLVGKVPRPRHAAWIRLAYSVVGGLVGALFLNTPVAANPSGDLGIITYPIGLVTGELPIDVDLGARGTPATLYLDGESVCEMTEQDLKCTVDLGPDPHQHLLELVRPGASGRDIERAFRWVNRPGQEAELRLGVGPPDEQGRCYANIISNHPLKQRPAFLEIRVDDEPQPIESDDTVAVPCPEDGDSRILVASAIFPDGRRVEDVQLLGGGFVGQVDTELNALPVLAPDMDTFCELAEWPEGVVRAEPAGGFEVVIVLDPKVPYARILETGWFGGGTDSSTGIGDTGSDVIGVQQRSRAPSNEMRTDKESGSTATWRRAEVNLQTAERLWYVAPAGTLPRVDGFAAGRGNWLKLLFKFGMGEFPGNPRLADAVASSGLVAAGGGARRVVVLLLSNKSEDESQFTPQQAMDYLAEVGVPLVVFRSGKPKGDGWPDGVKNSNMASMAKNLEGVSDLLDRQCMIWFEGGSLRADQLAASLPNGFHVAGHGDAPPATQWNSLSLEELTAIAGLDEEGDPQASPFTASPFTGRLDLVAVTVLVSASGDDGRPIEDLLPPDLTVSEDGHPVEVVGLERLSIGQRNPEASPASEGVEEEPQPLPVSIYLEPSLVGRRALQQVLETLATKAETLTSIGPVEVVLGLSRAEQVLAPTLDPGHLSEFLGRYQIPSTGRQTIAAMRNQYSRDIKTLPGRATSVNQLRIRTLAAVGEEHRSVTSALGVLSEWALGSGAEEPRLLLLVGTGFDENPDEFYIPLVEGISPGVQADLRSRFHGFNSGEQVQRIARELAGHGWRVIAVAAGGSASTTSASEDGSHRVRSFLTDGASTQIEPGTLVLDPILSQRRIAQPSGGSVAASGEEIAAALDGARGWYRLTYQAERPPDGADHALAVSVGRAGVHVRSPEVVTSESSVAQAELRLRGLLDGASDLGRLNVTAGIGGVHAEGQGMVGKLEVATDLETLKELMSALGGGVFRVSVLVRSGDQESVAHQTVVLEAVGGFVHTMELAWSRNARVSVGVEDLSSGEWGGLIMDLP